MPQGLPGRPERAWVRKGKHAAPAQEANIAAGWAPISRCGRERIEVDLDWRIAV